MCPVMALHRSQAVPSLPHLLTKYFGFCTIESKDNLCLIWFYWKEIIVGNFMYIHWFPNFHQFLEETSHSRVAIVTDHIIPSCPGEENLQRGLPSTKERTWGFPWDWPCALVYCTPDRPCGTLEHRQKGPKAARCLAEQANRDKAVNYSEPAESLQREIW